RPNPRSPNSGSQLWVLIGGQCTTSSPLGLVRDDLDASPRSARLPLRCEERGGAGRRGSLPLTSASKAFMLASVGRRGGRGAPRSWHSRMNAWALTFWRITRRSAGASAGDGPSGETALRGQAAGTTSRPTGASLGFVPSDPENGVPRVGCRRLTRMSQREGGPSG